MFRINSDELLAHPFQASIFITSVVTAPFLPLLRPPFMVSALMAFILVRVSMFFGARFARENFDRPDSSPTPEIPPTP